MKTGSKDATGFSLYLLDINIENIRSFILKLEHSVIQI